MLMLLAGCGRKPEEFDALAESFVFDTLALAPVTATVAGYHQHKGVALDTQLDDWSTEGLKRQQQVWADYRKKFAGFERAKLSAESRGDYDLIQAQLGLAELEFKTIQNYRHNPTLYVETVGNALFTPFAVEYAPTEERYRHIVARLKGLPQFFENAKKQLAGAPEIWRNVAIAENDDNIALVEKTLREKLPAALKGEYDAAAPAALAALRGFDTFIEQLPDEGKDGWRLGKEQYAKKFPLALGVKTTPEELLKAAEDDLKATRLKMFQLSLPLHKKWYPTHRDPVDLNLIVGETLQKIAAQHAQPERYFDAARKTLEETRAFVKSKDFLTMPPRDNLQLIETPGYMRGIYGVGGFNAAPPLEPQLGAFYWLTPIPKDWPKERVESKLREYNNYGLPILTIHEAIPGHYVQAEYASTVEPRSRRVLRSLLGNNVYIEGWAVYVTEVMLDEGFMNGSPELRIMFLKHQLRSIANAILDIRMQTLGMTDEEAMALMLDKTFQEREEAVAKLQRAKLASCQLPTYFTGYKEWVKLRERVKAAQGGKFSLKAFHERALKQGALPMGALGSALGVE
jgi:uncharacterized protein (DUF885 family)